MDVEKTMQFILEQMAHCSVLHAKNEALHAKHEGRFARHEASRAEHEAEIKQIRRLMLQAAAMRVEDRQLTREIKKELKVLTEKMQALAEQGRETKKELQAFLRSLRGRSGNGASRKT